MEKTINNKISNETNITIEKIKSIYNLDLFDLVSKAHESHKINYTPGEIQKSQLLSIKTGGCPENCSYCPQSAHYKTGVEKEPLMSVDEVVEKALKAQSHGASRFCMGAAWREVKDGPQFDQVCEIVKEVKNLGMEVCCTLGMLTENQATKLKDAGLYAYNHNIDTSRNYYKKVITTRNFDDRLETIDNVRKAGITVCTGGILGMGETDQDRMEFIEELYNMTPHPESITINTLVKIEGTPLSELEDIHPFDVIRVIATCRVLMPKAMIRLSAGRLSMSDTEQFLCFFSGANSIFLGEKLLTSPNPKREADYQLLDKINASDYETQKQIKSDASPTAEAQA